MSLLPPDDGLASAARETVVGLEADLAGLVRPLDGIDERPVEEHPAAYEELHTGLRGVLDGDAEASPPSGAVGEDAAPGA